MEGLEEGISGMKDGPDTFQVAPACPVQFLRDCKDSAAKKGQRTWALPIKFQKHSTREYLHLVLIHISDK